MSNTRPASVDILPGPFGSQAHSLGYSTEQMFAGNRLDLVQAILEDNERAGATVGVAPTFAAAQRGINELPTHPSITEWNRRAVAVATEVFKGRKVLASIAPILDTSGADDSHWSEQGSIDWARRRHQPQIETLREAKVDRFLAEAFRYTDEAKGLAKLVEELGGQELICAFEARHEEGRFPHQPELTFAQIHDQLVSATRGNLNVRIGINCASAADCTRVLENEPNDIFAAVYPNAAKVGTGVTTNRFVQLARIVSRTTEQETEFQQLQVSLNTGNHELEALAKLCLQRRVDYIGICCGGTPSHVRLLRKTVDKHRAQFPSSGHEDHFARLPSIAAAE